MGRRISSLRLAVLVVVAIAHLSFANTSWGQVSESERKKQFEAFAERVVPELVRLSERLGLKGKVDYRELADGATFSYREALIKLRGTLGTWSDDIAGETELHLYLDCFIEARGALPRKDQRYLDTMRPLRKVVYNGALDRTVTYAALKSGFYETRYSAFTERRPKLLSEIISIEALFDLRILGQAESLREKFK